MRKVDPLDRTPRWIAGVEISISIIVALLPLILYYLYWRSIALIMPAQALEMLNQPQSQALLVDVRSASDFSDLHVKGAFNWPYRDIEAVQTLQSLPEQYQNRTLILLCDSGWLSARAARHLQALGVADVYSVRGGYQEWAKAAWRAPELKFSLFSTSGKPDAIPVSKLPPAVQAAQLIAGFVIKPLYMLISLILVVLLLSQRHADLYILGWGLLCFLVGEVFCYINLLVFGDNSYLSEYLHSYGMALGFALVMYAVMEGLETRLLHTGHREKRCALLPICGLCWKDHAIACRARQMARLLIPLLAVLCFIPLMASFSSTAYTGLVFGFPYYYARFYVYQAYEIRFLPLLALLLFLLAYPPLWLSKEPPLPIWTRIFVAGSVGALGFSLFRLALGAMFDTQQIWFNFWEETTELLFVLAVSLILWLFRRTVLVVKAHATAA